MTPALLKIWAKDDEDLQERLNKCHESFAWRGHLIVEQLRMLRDENLALLRELELRDEQVNKLANALTMEERV